MNRPIHGIIPARYASTRFPGKPLALLHGKPMFWHVWARASACAGLRGVTVCTDDARIAEAAAALSVPYVMTRDDHPNGSARVHEAAVAAGVPAGAVVVNIQGDEPALAPSMLDDLLAPFADEAVKVTTLAAPMGAEEARSPDRVKVVRSLAGDALYFSRSPIPYDREGDTPGEGFLLHVGLYAYRMATLARYVSLPPSPLEGREKLEQLRFLENGIPVRVALTRHRAHGEYRPEDLENILPLMGDAPCDGKC
jgi:3-deoxy-manno-octulosonate cytidylyltransferase (CMP-KDO synthetase)